MSQKYPRTPHLPWSPGATADDERIFDVSHFEGRRIIVTEKMDGECTTIHRGGCHARSLDTAPHPSRDWVRALAGRIRHGLPEDWRLVGENLFAEHSICYNELPSYFLLFGMYVGDLCLSWDEMAARIENETMLALGFRLVPVLYDGLWNEEAVYGCFTGKSQCGGKQEGYVVRLADEFKVADFGRSVAKFVRAGHVQTNEHWLKKPVVQNGLRGGV